VLEAADVDPFFLTLECLLQDAAHAAEKGRFDEARARYASAVERDLTGTSLSELGHFFWRTGRLVEAAETFGRLLALAERTHDETLRAVACNNLAAVHREAGNAALALAYQQRSWDAEQHAAEIGHRDCETGCDFGNRANDAILAGDLAYAERLLRLSLRWELKNGTKAGAADDWGNLGVIALLRGHSRRALYCLHRALRLHRSLGDHRGIGCDLLHLGLLCDMLQRRRAAIRFLRRAEHHLQQSGTTHLLEKATRILREIERCVRVETFDARLN